MNSREKGSVSTHRVEPGRILDSGRMGRWMDSEECHNILRKSHSQGFSTITKFKAGGSTKE